MTRSDEQETIRDESNRGQADDDMVMETSESENDHSTSGKHEHPLRTIQGEGEAGAAATGTSSETGADHKEDDKEVEVTMATADSSGDAAIEQKEDDEDEDSTEEDQEACKPSAASRDDLPRQTPEDGETTPPGGPELKKAPQKDEESLQEAAVDIGRPTAAVIQELNSLEDEIMDVKYPAAIAELDGIDRESLPPSVHSYPMTCRLKPSTDGIEQVKEAPQNDEEALQKAGGAVGASREVIQHKLDSLEEEALQKAGGAVGASREVIQQKLDSLEDETTYKKYPATIADLGGMDRGGGLPPIHCPPSTCGLEPSTTVSSSACASLNSNSLGPGAYASSETAPIDFTNESNPAYFRGANTPQVAEQSNTSASSASLVAPEDNLAVATPVSIDIQEARQEDMRPQEEEDQKHGCWRHERHWRWMSVLLVLALVAIPVFAVLGIYLRRDSVEDQEDATSLNTAATPPPKVSLEASVLALLPNHTQSAIQRQGSAQSKAYQWLITDPFLKDYPETRIIQRFALASFFFATGGDTEQGWAVDTDWLSYELSECSWFSDTVSTDGVDCTRPCLYGSFALLCITGNELKGSLPEEISLLTSLMEIRLDSNLLTGTVPKTIKELTDLKAITIFGNSLTGTIPPEICELSELRQLRLSWNHLSGPIPSCVGRLVKLQKFGLGYNSLTGSLPTTIGKLQEVVWIGLLKNNLTGHLPSEIGLLSNNLGAIRLEDNHCSGSLPTCLANLQELYSLVLSSNSFTGHIPSEIGLLSNRLNILMLANNHFSGTIPPQLGIESIDFVHLQGNYLTESIPTELGLSFHLQELNLENNMLTGAIPSELGRTGMVTLSLGSNRLSGTLPSELGLVPISNFSVANNQLMGRLPSELGHWAAARKRNATAYDFVQFNVANNLLTGEVPKEVGALATNAPHLETFNLTGNFLSGELPTDLCFIDPSVLSFDCSLKLCGCSCSCV
jgi:hypothetical protein